MKKTTLLLMAGIVAGKFVSPYTLSFPFFAILLLIIIPMHFRWSNTEYIRIIHGCLIFTVGCMISLFPETTQKIKYKQISTLINQRKKIQFYGNPVLVYKNRFYYLYKLKKSFVILSGEIIPETSVPVYFCSRKHLAENSSYIFFPAGHDSIKHSERSIFLRKFKLIQDRKNTGTSFTETFQAWVYNKSCCLKESYRHFLQQITTASSKSPPGQLSLHIRSLGLSHLLAISGLHFSILFIFLKFLRIKKLMLLLSVPFLYLCLLGFRASAFRSFVMISCYLIARKCNRSIFSKRFMYFSMILICVFTPDKVLSYSTLFSFTATFALLKSIETSSGVKSFFSISFQIFIFTSGLGLLLGKKIYLSSILLNPFIIPVFSVVFLFCLAYILCPVFLDFITVPLLNTILGMFSGFFGYISCFQKMNLVIENTWFRVGLITFNCLFIIFQLFKDDEFAEPSFEPASIDTTGRTKC